MATECTATCAGRLRHIKYEAGWEVRCPRCLYVEDGLADLRHEAVWTAAALIVLAIHIALDFVA